MALGKYKMLFLKSVIAIIGCASVVISHQVGYEWYMNHFTPSSRGISLGFVVFYMRCVIVPSVFVSAFIKAKYSLVIGLLINIYMFFLWYETNPLRVILMLISYLVGYILVVLIKLIRINKI